MNKVKLIFFKNILFGENYNIFNIYERKIKFLDRNLKVYDLFKFVDECLRF